MSNPPNKKLCALHLSTGNYLRGGERQMVRLHEGILKKGLLSSIVCKAGSEISRQTIEGLFPVPWHGELDLAGLFRIRKIAKSVNASVLHCHDAHALSHGSLVGAMLGIPVIYTRRVVFPMHGNPFSRWKYGQCRMLLAISNAVAKQCSSIVPQEKIRIIADGVDWASPILSRGEARDALGVPEKAFAIGTVGYFTKEKNIPFINAVATALNTNKNDALIVCIGPWDADPNVGISKNIIFTGLKPDATNYYNAFDAYISASTHEGLGSALLDAVVRDIPAAAIDGGGTRDIFPDNWDLFSPDDTTGFIAGVENIIGNYSSARKQAKICGTRARSLFSVEAMVEKTIDAYNTPVNQQGPL
jgi:L-malate glycosyltransferase